MTKSKLQGFYLVLCWVSNVPLFISRLALPATEEGTDQLLGTSISTQGLESHLDLETVVVSFGCYNKLPQIWWFKNNMYLFSYISAGQKSKITFPGPNQHIGRTMLSSEPLGENLSLDSSSFWWHSKACGCIMPIFAFVIMLPSLLSVKFPAASCKDMAITLG